MKLYKILNEKTGLYSDGGMFPGFSKVGKKWRGLNFLKNHLHLFQNRYWPYEDCIVVEEEYEYLTETIIGTAKEFFSKLRRKKK